MKMKRRQIDFVRHDGQKRELREKDFEEDEERRAILVVLERSEREISN